MAIMFKILFIDKVLREKKTREFLQHVLTEYKKKILLI